MQVDEPGIDLTVYPVIALPLSPGAVQPTVAWPFSPMTPTPLGASGTPGLTATDVEAVPNPLAFRAFTVTVYRSPLTRPLRTQEVAPVVVQAFDPGLALTAYPVIARPPLLTGADHLTVASRSPGVANTFVGGPGTVTDATAGDAIATRTITGKRALETASTFHPLKPDDLRIPPTLRQTDRARTLPRASLGNALVACTERPRSAAIIGA